MPQVNSNKRIIVCCDGTGADANAINIPYGVGFAIGKYATNVARLARSIKAISDDGFEQIVFYQSGVGSTTDFSASTITGTTWSQLRGVAVATKIREAYAYISQNYAEGDEICLFGFSRGAYTARKLAELIDAIGLLKTQELGTFFQWWSYLVDVGTIDPHDKPGRDTKIKCVGVWDTVGSVAGAINALHIKDDAFPLSLTTALHAVSLQDNREPFLPTLWSPPAGGLRPDQTLTEVWFPGAHCDVGGGYEHHELSDVALFWMADQLMTDNPIVDLDLDFIWRCKGYTTDAWGTTQPHNTWQETMLVPPKNRLHLCKKNFNYHESIHFAPLKLDHPSFMFTLEDLKKKFGGSWEPTCPILGSFEAQCKKQWLTPGTVEIPFENTLQLFDPVIWVDASPEIQMTDMIQSGIPRDDFGNLNVPNFVARVSQNGAIYPGTVSPSREAKYSRQGKVYRETSNYQVLVGNPKYVRWQYISGDLQIEKLKGAVLVPGGYDADGLALYIAALRGSQNTYGGYVKEGSTAKIVRSEEELTVPSYHVLVYNALEAWTPIADTVSLAVPETIDNVAMDAAQLFMALNKFDLDLAVPNGIVGVYVYYTDFTATTFTLHAEYPWLTRSSESAASSTAPAGDKTTDPESTLDPNTGSVLDAGLSWLVLNGNDPDYQCGEGGLYSDFSNPLPSFYSERINFPTGFSVPPNVVLGICAVKMAGDWRLSVFASDIDAYGFTLKVNTLESTRLVALLVNWLAYRPGKDNIRHGCVNECDGHVEFGLTFGNTPKILTGLTSFEFTKTDPDYFRLRATTWNVNTSGMDTKIETWGSQAKLGQASFNYIAIDTSLAA